MKSRKESFTTVEKMGYSFYLKFVSHEDLELLLEINMAGFEFFKTVPIADRLNYDISYDFGLKQPSENVLMVNHKLTPLELDNSGNMWLALCVVSNSSKRTSGNVIIRRKNNKETYRYNFISKEWSSHSVSALSKTERQILLKIATGLTSEEIAQQLSLSQNTIKFHRKNVLKKLGVSNIIEALAYAENNQLI